MAKENIIQDLIARLGQSQADRLPSELDRHYVDVDEREGLDLLRRTAALAASLRYYSSDPETATGTWSSFFPTEKELQALLDRKDGGVPPHLGLIAAFLHLYRFPRDAINTITGRHLDFQFRRVLCFEPLAAQPDHAHLVLELKKGAPQTEMTTDQMFSAGKDAHGELLYRSVRDVVLNQAKVTDLRSVFRDEAGLRFAPVANSADGLGAPLDASYPQWRPFGHAGLPSARIGFAFSSPVLRMQEGNRTVSIELQLATLDPARHTAATLARTFEAHVSGPAGWLGPFALSGTLSSSRLMLSFQVPASAPAVVDYKMATHGHAFAAQAPIVQLLLGPTGGLRYADLEGLTVSSSKLTVEVDAMSAVTLENEYGSLNPKKAFQPFGPQPVPGSRLMIGCEEALSKRLSSLKVKLRWQGVPASLVDWYAGYRNAERMNNGVTATMLYQDRGGQTQKPEFDLMARDAEGASTLSLGSAAPRPETYSMDARLFSLMSARSEVGTTFARRMMRAQPVFFRPQVPQPPLRTGFITVSLQDDFLHADYRRETISNALAQNRTVLNEPYTPTVQSISLSYRAQSDEVDVSRDDFDSFTNPDLQFFTVGCFGQMRDHAFLRNRFLYVEDKRVPLLPHYPDEGEFLIGITGVAGGDSLSLLMQTADGSADPDLAPQSLTWSVLADSYWRPLSREELVLDTSRSLRATGIVALTLPSETTTQHTWMPPGMVWLRASIHSGSAAACRLVGVAANAVEVQLAEYDDHVGHLSSGLEAGRIVKLKTALAAVKTVAQPFSSFGGRLLETDASLTRRAAERLRHRGRCVTPWDYERVLLEAFPQVHKVKCIPHASETSWLAPGNLTLVVVPDLRNTNAVDQLRPRVDLDTLTRMKEFVHARTGPQVRISVRNPRYDRIRLDFQVQFKPGNPFNFTSGKLNDFIVRTLSPWAYDATRTIEFGGEVFRSVLMNLIEELHYVDFVTNFKMLSLDSAAPNQDHFDIRSKTPDAILVSDSSHTIAQFKDD